MIDPKFMSTAPIGSPEHDEDIKAVQREAMRPRKLMIAIPCIDGKISAACAASVWAIAKDPNVELSKVWQYPCDIARARSRAVAHMLTKTDATDLLFWDADVEAEPACIIGLLGTCKDVVCAPYPFKRIDWGKVAKEVNELSGYTADQLEAAAYDYPYHLSKDARPDAKACVEVDGVPMGMTLISRTCLETMCDHYASTLLVTDKVGPMVALFLPLIVGLGTPGSMLLSEDYSFCHRWRAIGGLVHMYVGPGTPCAHHGTHRYRGSREGMLGL